MEGNTGKLAERLLAEAIKAGASDLHVEPCEADLRVRIRVDGLLQEMCRLPLSSQSSLITQLKVASGMDIAEKRIPQDGRMTMNVEGVEADLRLATLPALAGEKVAVRILNKNQSLLQLENLSMSKKMLRLYRQLYAAPNGLVLATGPTGSGKTTTLYATLAQLNRSTHNIITIEDPVEYRLPGINQVAINRKAGLDFAVGLRAIVRQDPDIIMLGEIRDKESAAIAVHAALTGHLVLSTLHTNSAAGAVSRLLDMGVEPYLLAASLRGVLAQRLVRRICPHCREQYIASAGESLYLGKEGTPLTLWRGRGCTACRGTGYAGRMAVQEILPVSAAAAKAIAAGQGDAALQELGQTCGGGSLYEDGAAKVLSGQTTVEELWRAGIYPGGSYAF